MVSANHASSNSALEFKHTFGRIVEFFISSLFQDHILLIFMKNTGPEKQVQAIEKSV